MRRPGLGAIFRLPAKMPMYAASLIGLAAFVSACDDGDAPGGGAEVAFQTPVPQQTGPQGLTPVPPTPAEGEATARGALAPSGSPLLLPDLRVSEPHELYIQYGVDGVREIRFSTLISNLGDGRLAMTGTPDPAANIVVARQIVDHADGSMSERAVGRFVYHPDHFHWHFEDFIVFELWSVDAAFDRRDLLATTGKMTYCLADSYPVEDPPPNAAEYAKVTSCDQEVQGISVGWVDVYEAQFPGQELDIPDLPDGTYAIRTVADPDGLVLETDTANNDSVAIVEIEGMEIRIVEGEGEAAQRGPRADFSKGTGAPAPGRQFRLTLSPGGAQLICEWFTPWQAGNVPPPAES